MQVVKVKCELCGADITKSQMSKHLRRHKDHPETFKQSNYAITHPGLTCQFCDKLCKNKNSLCNHERLCSANPNKQLLPDGFLKYNARIKTGEIEVWNKGKSAKTDARVAQQKNSLAIYYQTHQGSFSGKKHSNESKKLIGEGVKKYLKENPDMVPYKRNHSSKTSYPEEYFSNLFKQEGLDLQEQFSVKTYRLDFCNPIKKIDIEVDGEQHYVDPAIVEHDVRRNAALEEDGWVIYRIRWADYKKMPYEYKKEVIKEIKELLEN